jgi:hypothetical protein
MKLAQETFNRNCRTKIKKKYVKSRKMKWAEIKYARLIVMGVYVFSFNRLSYIIIRGVNPLSASALPLTSKIVWR